MTTHIFHMDLNEAFEIVLALAKRSATTPEHMEAVNQVLAYAVAPSVEGLDASVEGLDIAGKQ